MKNESAFPFFHEDRVKQNIGMSLRDYFAAKSVFIASKRCSSYKQMAEEAYKLADVMLKEREKHEPNKTNT